MVADALVKANDFLEISSSVEDPSCYWKVLEMSTSSYYLRTYSLYVIEYDVDLLFSKL